MNILVTGSTGFIGRALINQLVIHSFKPLASVRKQTSLFPSHIEQVVAGDILPNTVWKEALSNIDVVIHLAARVHFMNDTNTNPLAEFQKVNTGGTLNLAQQAAESGVKRFIFLSSIKVNGESTSLNNPFSSKDTYVPSDPYGLSKYEAEQGLKKIAKETGMEVVIIRPPLVYGPNVKANFLSMMEWLYKGVPLPLGSIHNKRSLVALDNLIDLIITCINHPAAVNETFLVSDGEDLSTTDLLQSMTKALGKPSRLIPIPSSILTLSAILLGKREVAQRLCGSLQVDISHTENTLSWIPPVSVDEALQKTADAYLKQLNKNKLT